MTRLRLLLRNLIHFRGVNCAVLLGMAVATAVLSGALMVGDSVRASLRELTLQRLGKIDDAILATSFFDASLASRLAPQTHGVELSATIVVAGAASEDATKAHTADVQIASGAWVDVAPGKCTINGDLADALGIKAPGATIVLSVPIESDLPREGALDRRSRGDTINALRVEVIRIVRDRSVAALFNPSGIQRPTRNAWVNLADLQDALSQPGRVNALMAHLPDGTDGPTSAATLNGELSKVVTLEDYGLTRTPVVGQNMTALGSRQTYIAPPIVEAADSVSAKLSIPLQKISVNLLTSVAAAASKQTVHYAVVAAVSELDGQSLGAAQAAINQWTAEQLGAKIGDSITIDYQTRASTGELVDASKTQPATALQFTIAKILPMEGIGADPSLPPDYKGLTDADSVADWNPPEGLTIDKKLVTSADEAYWRKFHAAPKVFLNFDTAQKLWGNAYGQVTGLRVASDRADAFCAALRGRIDPASMQLAFRPIKSQQLAAAGQGTDFSEYFLYFSFFLIVAAAQLVAMLFRLGVEQRARQLGLLSAVGFAPGALRRLALSEGLILATLGGLLGAAMGIGYTWLIMAGLRTWWVGAVGTTALRLSVEPMTLAAGFVAGVIVAMSAVAWGAWRIGRTPPARLLAGSWTSETGRRARSGIVRRVIGIALLICGLAALVAAIVQRKAADQAFLAGGSLLLFGSLIWLGGALRPRSHDRSAPRTPTMSLLSLGIANATRHTLRSVLAIGLIAFAVFTLIVVAVMRQGTTAPSDDRKSSTGGYRLILQAAIPIFGDLNTSDGRRLAGFRHEKDPLWSQATFTPMRRWAGQDISCLNLTRPTAPTILSVPNKMLDRNAFTFAAQLSNTANPWTLLKNGTGTFNSASAPNTAAAARDGGSDAIPVIADDQTAQYILQLPIGGEMTITDQLGRSQRLKLVATLSHSIFQSELLMGEENFRKLFPAIGGYSCLLIDCTAADASNLRTALGSELEEYSASVDTTAGRLAMYDAVANTYLATFQTLGSLGLLLGTIGLAVVLVRTVLERKPELALLACLGFTASARVRLVLAENAFLLLLGMIVGTVCALIGVLPAIASSGRSMNFTGLIFTLSATTFTGLASSTLAVLLSALRVVPADLRRE